MYIIFPLEQLRRPLHISHCFSWSGESHLYPVHLAVERWGFYHRQTCTKLPLPNMRSRFVDDSSPDRRQRSSDSPLLEELGIVQPPMPEGLPNELHLMWLHMLHQTHEQTIAQTHNRWLQSLTRHNLVSTLKFPRQAQISWRASRHHHKVPGSHMPQQ